MNRPKNTAATVIAVIVAVVLLVGLTLAARVIFQGAVRDANYDWNSYDVTGQFRDLELHSTSCDLYLYPSDDGRCTVYYSGAKGVSADIRVEDGVLCVTETDGRNWFRRLLSGEPEYPYISVYLPGESYGDLYAATVSGDIDITDCLAFGNVTLSSTSGEIWLFDTAADTITLETVSGGISLYNAAADDFTISSVSGSISATLTGAMNFDLSSTSGSVYAPAPDRTAGPFRATTVSGSIWINVD